MSHKKSFITFEGGEGAGKTTLITKICAQLQARQIPFVQTREPGGCMLAEKVRNLILDSGESLNIGIRAELLLFLAARAQHVEEVILPSLSQGKVVICDRFHDSTIAYQGIARALGLEEVQHLSNWAAQELQPNLTFYLDIDPLIGMQRVGHRGSVKDRMELENLNFHNKVREGFVKLAQYRTPKQYNIIDAAESPDQVFNKVWQIIAESIGSTK
ncbi:MAG: tmk [Chlamydiales bacterium]|jgi:dTMP kinase|nr:tmk [Chlamydiales bacterium]